MDNQNINEVSTENMDTQKKKRATKALNDFRTNATPEQWQEIADDYEKMDNDSFRDKYEFTRGGIKPYLKENGLITDQAPGKSNLAFAITYTDDRPSMVSRSVQLDEKIQERLKNLEKDQWKVSKALVLNQLLHEALQKYGY